MCTTPPTRSFGCWALFVLAFIVCISEVNRYVYAVMFDGFISVFFSVFYVFVCFLRFVHV